MASINNAEGFTVLETLIGFLILSLALGISAQTIALASKSVSVAKERREVMHAADALLAMDLSDPVEPGRERSGRIKNLNWIRRMTPIATTQGAEGPSFSVLTIRSPSGREHRYLAFHMDAK